MNQIWPDGHPHRRIRGAAWKGGCS